MNKKSIEALSKASAEDALYIYAVRRDVLSYVVADNVTQGYGIGISIYPKETDMVTASEVVKAFANLDIDAIERVYTLDPIAKIFNHEAISIFDSYDIKIDNIFADIRELATAYKDVPIVIDAINAFKTRYSSLIEFSELSKKIGIEDTDNMVGMITYVREAIKVDLVNEPIIEELPLHQ